MSRLLCQKLKAVQAELMVQHTFCLPNGSQAIHAEVVAGVLQRILRIAEAELSDDEREEALR